MGGGVVLSLLYMVLYSSMRVFIFIPFPSFRIRSMPLYIIIV
jgi:hypothetical protein